MTPAELRRIREQVDKVDPKYKENPFNPLEQVTKILKSPEKVKEMKELEENLTSMEDSIRKIINAYYDGFSQSNKNYASIIKFVSDSRENVDALVSDMTATEAQFKNRSSEIATLYNQKKECDHMLGILEKIDKVRQVPELLDKYLEAKHYMHYAELVGYASELLMGEDLLAVGEALADLTRDIFTRKYQFFELLVGEFNERVYAPHGLEIVLPTAGSASGERVTLPRKTHKKSSVTRAGRYDDVGQHVVTGRVNLAEAPFVEDLKQRYDTQPKAFLCVVVEAWARLDQVHHACSLVLEQMTSLLHGMMNDIIRDTQKAVQAQSLAQLQIPVAGFAAYGPTTTSSGSSALPVSIESSTETTRASALKQLLESLYAAFLNVLRAHKFAVLVLNQVSEREKAAGRLTKSDASSLYSMREVWATMQPVLIQMLGSHLQGHYSSDAQTISSTPSGASRLFSFSGSSAAMEYETALARQKAATVFRASPYNITIIYPLTMKFHSAALEAAGLLRSKVTDRSVTRLKNFVEDFVENTFVDHIKSDFARRAAQTADSPDAFRIRERNYRVAYRVDEPFRPLLLGALRTFDNLRQLLEYMTAIPAHATLFGQTASATLVQYLQKCRQRYDDIIEGTEAAKVVRNRSNLTLLASDPAWKTLKRALRAERATVARADGALLHGSLEYDDERFAELQQRMEAPLYRSGIGVESARSQFFLDSTRIATLASMSDSLDWLADRIDAEADAQPAGAAALAVELPEQLRQLADQCLLYLHEEFRCHCFFLLDSIRGQSYALEEPPADADTCVLDLNRDLLSSDELVSSLLPQSKRRYLFDGLSRLVAQLLIRALVDIPRWNHNGVLKMCRNVFALQQNLTPLFGAKEDRLDRTRRFYELLELAEEEIFAVLGNSGKDASYSFQELKILFEAKTSNRKISERTLERIRDLTGGV